MNKVLLYIAIWCLSRVNTLCADHEATWDFAQDYAEQLNHQHLAPLMYTLSVLAARIAERKEDLMEEATE